MKKTILLIIILLAVSGGIFAQKWTNPITLGGEWSQYGIGDPYILKYRGTYYLYCSTRDHTEGVKCWSSKDLVNWSSAYMCSTDPITKGAYAPEVFYWNGTFYMYTSPGGYGHYVLTSTSPTGPFTRVTENFGKSIDGSVFVDDDGKWYFYYAGGGTGGIQGAPMSSPTVVGDGKNLGATMLNDWTEGPTVFKRNGVYYIVYTGNHVISKGYRIDYAKNFIGPINMYAPQARQNPILLSAEGNHVGLGHGSAFIGPDLDSYYYTYHSLAGDYGWGPYRRFNYDRIAWNGDKMSILGPTTWGQQVPETADFADFFERAEIGADWTNAGGSWGITDNDFLFQNISNEETWHKVLSNPATGSKYTAEFTIREAERGNDNAKLGAVFGYSDESNYGIAVFRTYTNQLEISFQVNGTWSEAVLANLPSDFDYTAWHSIRIEKTGESYKFFVDGMLKSSLTSSLEGGKIGYMTSWSRGNFGYIAFSNKVNGSGIFDVYKPVPGTIEAVHYNTGGEGVGYHDLTPENSGGKYIREDGVDINDCSEGGHAITAIQAGEWYKYNVNIRYPLAHNVGIRYKSTTEAGLRIWLDDEDITGVVPLPSTNSAWRTFTVKNLDMKNGYHTLKVEAVSGEFELYKMQFDTANNTPVTKGDTFDTAFTGWYYADGTWSIESGQAYISGYGKRSMGNAAWTDYTVEVDVTYANSLNGGLLLRAKNLSLGSNGTSAQAGTDFLQGYFVTLSANSVVLGKQNYNWTQLTTAPGSYVTNRKYALKATVTGDNIKVFVDNKLVIDYTDPDPFINGRPGLRVHNANIYFDNFQVTVHGDETSVQPEMSFTGNDIDIYPNPTNGMLSISNISDFSDLCVFKIDGQQVYSSKLMNDENSLILNISDYQNGLYLLKLANNNHSVIKKIVKN